ncbi:PH domain-containing protein [Streptomyces roseicoloratus]|uniref:PH domain-containing protein n=1 Tax=Streptomyces roseicoloratus TaxID=2508722 RepID=A0ABY9RVX9_9ACTN|nr:PH domain-containing protein [Streptomyces roseicoloratus]WMX45374.1 PH domain-containing protein [Streptomyces roseicoloratus]
MTTPEPPAPQPSEPVQDRAFRSPMGIAGGVFLLALAVVIGGDSILRGHGRTPWLALAALLMVIPVVVAFTIRPAVFAGTERLRIRNPFRTVTLPWGAVADVRAGDSSEALTQEGRTYQLWAIPVSLRQRKRAARQAARASQDDPHRRTSVTADVRDSKARTAPADQAVAELRELAERRGGLPECQGEPRVRWAYEVIAPAVAGLVLLVILSATG